MSVKIRLTRMGDKKSPFYRVVVADSRSPRDGKFIEILGTYDPLKQPAVVKIDNEKAAKWLSNGAQPTDTAKSLLITAGVIPAPKKRPPAKNYKKAEAPVAEAKPEVKKEEPKAEVKPALESAVEPIAEVKAEEAVAEPAAEAVAEPVAEVVEPVEEIAAPAEETATETVEVAEETAEEKTE